MSRWGMETDEAIDRAAQDGADVEAFSVGSLCQLVTEIPGDAAYERNGYLGMAIGADIVTEKIAEVIDHDLIHGII